MNIRPSTRPTRQRTSKGPGKSDLVAEYTPPDCGTPSEDKNAIAIESARVRLRGASRPREPIDLTRLRGYPRSQHRDADPARHIHHRLPQVTTAVRLLMHSKVG